MFDVVEVYVAVVKDGTTVPNTMFVALTVQAVTTVAVTLKLTGVVVLPPAEATGAKPSARNPSKAADMADYFIEKTPGN